MHKLIHTVIPAFLRLLGGVFYCNRGARPAFRNDGHVIADDVGLLIAILVRLKVAVVAAGHLSQHAVFYVGYQRRVLDDQVGHRVLAFPAHVLQMAFGVSRLVLCVQHFGRVAAGNVLPFKAGQGGR